MARISPPFARGWWYRWFTGQPLNGQYRTDATFARWGTKTVYPVRVHRWSYRPGYQRLVARWAGFPGGLVLPWAWFAHRTILLSTLGLLVATLVSWTARRLYLAHQHREMNRLYVFPLHDVLGPLLGLPQARRAAEYITVPPGFKKRKDRPVVIRLPRHFDASEAHQQALVDAVLAKIGSDEESMGYSFRLVGDDPKVIFTMTPKPPIHYGWEEAKALVKTLPVGSTLVGMAAEGKAVIIDWMVDDPHAAIQAGTGSGKSAFLMAQAVQWLLQGFRVFAIDPKMTSLDPLFPAKGFRVANDPSDVEGMWHLISVVHSEMVRRRNLRSKDRTLTWPLWFLILDEMTVFGVIDDRHWKRVKDSKDPAISEAFDMIIELWLMGREFGIRVVAVGQRVDQRTMRGMLGSSSTRAISKHQIQDWNRLFGGDSYQSPSVRRGRWFWKVSGAAPIAVQNLYLTDDEVTDAVRLTEPSDLPPVPVPVRVPLEGESVTASDDAEKGDRDIVGLEAAAEVLETSLEALRKRRMRAKKAGESVPGEGRQGNQPTFNRESLLAWYYPEKINAE